MSIKLTPLRLGIVWKMVRSQLIVKCDRVPKIGAKVYDSSLKEVGEVVSVFGPTSQPFAEVKSTNSSRRYIGEVLYVLEKTTR